MFSEYKYQVHFGAQWKMLLDFRQTMPGYNMVIIFHDLNIMWEYLDSELEIQWEWI